jgi:hypothetical protein
MSTATATTEQTDKPKAFRYRDFTKKGWPFMSRANAEKKRWARKSDGQPTKIYTHALAQATARKNGEEVPVRSRKAPDVQEHAGIQSPYDLNRRSGYKTIWQVLAENANSFVSHKKLHTEVNKRLAKDPTDKTGWYEANYKSKGKKYDTVNNAVVIARAPYNGIQSDGSVKPVSIEGLSQRVVIDTEQGVMLMTEVTEPRQFKKRGRKAKNEVVEDTDESVDVEAVEESEAVTA